MVKWEWKERRLGPRVKVSWASLQKCECINGKCMHLKWKISIVYTIWYSWIEIHFVVCLTKTAMTTTTAATTATTTMTIQNENNDFQPFMSLYNIVIEHGALSHFFVCRQHRFASSFKLVVWQVLLLSMEQTLHTNWKIAFTFASCFH